MKKIEQQIKTILSKGEIAQETVKEITTIIAELQKAGFKVGDTFPLGIPPYFDGVGLKVHFENNHLSTLGNLCKSPRFKGMEIFPYGIVAPELFSGTIRFK